MTPSQLEHLRLIDAHLDKLFDIAARRTPGEWKTSANYLISGWWVQTLFNEVAETSTANFCSETDATFIASCTGNAEAEWRAMKAAIKSLLALTYVPQVDASDEHLTCYEPYAKDANDILESILSVWPLNLITPKP